MTIRRLQNYAADVRRITAARDLRALNVARVAFHATEDGFTTFHVALERVNDPDAHVTVVSLADLAAENKRGTDVG